MPDKNEIILPRERDLYRERDELRAKLESMTRRKDEGFAALDQVNEQVVRLLLERHELRAEVERLQAALEQISKYPHITAQIARATLAKPKEC